MNRTTMMTRLAGGALALFLAAGLAVAQGSLVFSAVEVGGESDLARGVALEAQQRILAVHTASIVAHAKQARPAADKFHGDPPGSGIDAVFHQFLHDGGWTLDHFARRDLAGDFIGEQSNPSHAV